MIKIMIAMGTDGYVGGGSEMHTLRFSGCLSLASRPHLFSTSKN